MDYLGVWNQNSTLCDAHKWGKWTDWVQCPHRYYMCGFELKGEWEDYPVYEDDYVGMTGMKMICCRMPWDWIYWWWGTVKWYAFHWYHFFGIIWIKSSQNSNSTFDKQHHCYILFLFWLLLISADFFCSQEPSSKIQRHNFQVSISL